MSLVQGKCKKGFTPNLFRGPGVLKFFSNDFFFYRGLFLLAFLFLSSCSNDDSKSSSSSGNVDTTQDICTEGKVLLEGSSEECGLPKKGHYANGDQETACTDISNKEDWSDTPEGGLAEDKCPFTCNIGYVKQDDKDGRACNVPSVGKYADAEGVEQPCQGSNINFGTLGGQAISVATANDCPFACESGYVKTTSGSSKTCEVPQAGKYATAQGAEQACTSISGEQNSFDWEQSTTPVASATACPFTCKSGYVKNESGRTCNLPPTGKYATADGKEQPCSTIDDSTWSANTLPLSTDTCPFTCTGDKVKNSSGRTCDDPSLGFWQNNNTKTACTAIPNRKAWILPQSRLTTDTCDFTCKAGYKKVNTASTRACQVPAPGKYIDSDGTTARDCATITNKAAWVEGPADSATACNFTCTAGYEKHGRTCRTPSPGHYAENGKAEGCISIANSIWVANTAPVTMATGCAFECKAGFTKTSSACDLPSGHFVAGDGTAKSCGTAPDSSTGWADDQTVNQKSNCVFVCATTGRKVSGTGENGSCILERGYFAASGSDANGAGTPCGTVPASSTGWASTQLASVTQASDCVFECATGRTAVGTGPSPSSGTGPVCNLNEGHFPSSISANSVGTACSSLTPPTGHLLKTSFQNESLSRQNDCWVCSAGYDDDDGDGTCAETAATHYSLARSDDRVDCSTVTFPSSNAARDTSSTGKDSASDCWSCNEGYTYNGTTCVCDEGYTYNGTTCVREALAIAAGVDHTCAILSDQSVKCWGDNGYGQIGGGTVDTHLVISGTAGSPLSGGEKATHIAAGDSYTCAILSDQSVKCWGVNGYGQIGGGTVDTDLVISGTAGSPLSGGEKATHIAAGIWHTCAILSDQSVKCWGDNEKGASRSPLSAGEKAMHIVASGLHTCVILDDGRNLDNGGAYQVLGAQTICWGNLFEQGRYSHPHCGGE